MTETLTFSSSEILALIKSNCVLKSMDIPEFKPMVEFRTSFTFHLVKEITPDEIRDFIKEELLKLGKKDEYKIAFQADGGAVCTAVLVPENPDDKMKKILQTKFVDLDLPVRVLNVCKAADIETLAQMVVYNRQDLLKFRNFSKKSIAIIDDVLAERDLHFGMDVKKYGF